MSTQFLNKFALPLLLSLVAIFIQGSLLRYLLPDFAIPNLLLIMVVFLGFFEISPIGAILAFSIGLLLDLSSGVLIGPSAGSYTLIFGVLAALSTRLFVESGFAVAVTVFICSIFGNLTYLLLVSQFSPSAGQSLGVLFGEAFTSALLAPLIFILLKRILTPKRERSSTRLGPRGRHRIIST